MIDESILEWTESIVNQARTLLERDGRLEPVAFIISKDKLEILPLADRLDDDQKEETYRTIETYAKVTNAEAVLQIGEAWVKHLEPDEEITKEHVRDYEDKEEVVMVNLATVEGSRFASLPIYMDGEKKTFGSLVWEPGVRKGRGVFQL